MAVSTYDGANARRGLFLDKDGTLVENIPYNVDPSRIRLMPGAGEAVRSLAAAGFLPVVVSNQSGVARGRFEVEDLDAVEVRLAQLLRAHGVRLSGFYFCPHHPEGTVPGFGVECNCRKPEPGLIERAAGDLGIDLARSWMVGDILDDVEAGNRAGCRAVLIANGGETEWRPGRHRVPAITAPDLPSAAAAILKWRPVVSASRPGHLAARQT